MVDNNYEEASMREMMNEINASMKKIYEGDIIKGRILSVSNDEIVVNIGFMTDGVIPKEEVSYENEINLKDNFKENDEIYVYIMKINDGEGNVLLSKKRADSYKIWDELEEAFKNVKVFEVAVSEVVKGGVVTNIKGARAFIPASQLSNTYVKNLEEFLGKSLKVKITEFDKEKKKVVLSAKEIIKLEEANAKDTLWNNIGAKYKVNDVVYGKVVKLMNFGAFVELEKGVDGLVHISEISEDRILKPSDALNIGDKVRVKILDIKEKERRMSLSIKEAIEKPKEDYSEFLDSSEATSSLGDLFKDKLKDFKFD